MIITLPKHYNKRYYNRVLGISFSVIGVILFLKTCDNVNFDPTTAARASAVATLDTTKPKPQQQYFYSLKVPVQEFHSTMDTLQLIMREFGVDMKVSESR